MHGGRCLPAIETYGNVRPTNYAARSPGVRNRTISRTAEDLDVAFYHEHVLPRFWADVRRYNVTEEACAALCGPPSTQTQAPKRREGPTTLTRDNLNLSIR